jgi:Zn-dependent peptidase ImmA (M78 family)/DNA-binding XRE family transcriptional regulator
MHSSYTQRLTQHIPPMDATSAFPVNVGLRIKHARESRGLTQEQVSKAMGFKDRQTLSDLENGKRALKADELLRLSDVLDQDVEFFIDPFSVVAEAQYSWRASSTLPKEDLSRFEMTANSWIGLLRWLRAQEPGANSPLGFALRLDSSSSYEAAQYAAEQMVKQFKLGPVPAQRLASCIEHELDIPVLFVDTGPSYEKSAISGAVCHLPEMGVILVNRQESAARRNYDLAHELFHVLTWERMKPAHRESNSVEARERTKRVEQLADNFAAALLMPRVSLNELLDPARLKDVGHLMEVAQKLQVSITALGWRLLSLGRINEATRLALLQGQRTEMKDQPPQLFSAGFVKLLHVALDKGRISARKAAKGLGLSLNQLSELFPAYGLSKPFTL